MGSECYPISELPGTSALFREFSEAGPDESAEGPQEASRDALIRRWYPTAPQSMDWAKQAPKLGGDHLTRLCDALLRQADGFDASGAVLGNIERLRLGAAAVVTGQQVGLFGGPLLTLLKAATAIRKAQEATRISGREHVPVFWLASEDHDLTEVDQVTLPGKDSLETLSLGLRPGASVPVGNLRLDGGEESGREALEEQLDRVCELLGWAPVCTLLRECYAPDAKLAGAFGRLLTKVFASYGLVVMDASLREFHSLGAGVLRAAIERAEELERLLLERSGELVAAGYHAQVLVTPMHSLLFLIDAETGARLALHRTANAGWKAGGKAYTTEALLKILVEEPERISPNALLRPVFQDAILPTSAYVGGPAEVAYFAQSAVLYENIFAKDREARRVTPVLPRLSATLIDPAVAKGMSSYEIGLPQVIQAKTVEELSLRMAARAMPIEAKRRIAAVGNSMDTELTAMMEYMTAMSPDLGRSAGVSASKMRYQMNRLRRMAARFELQKEASIKKQATTIMLNLFPDGHPQERVLAGIWFLARFGDRLPEVLVEYAGHECPGHHVLYL